MLQGSKQCPAFVIMVMNRWECSSQILSCFGTNLPGNMNQFRTFLFVIIVGCDVMKMGAAGYSIPSLPIYRTTRRHMP
jgi:hypothetical protein